ncbi:MAG: hypothetical protein E3K32_04005 [wastewater metagenome]|nr:hypothetical protein [Candidatus Loosdrechtia aerotolerans]
MVNDPEDYPYSSARSRINGEANNFLKEPLFDKMEMADYKLHLKRSEQKPAWENRLVEKISWHVCRKN